jgi:peroxiredoxin
MSILAVGSKAPSVTLKSKSDAGLADVSLTRNAGTGSTVVLFFPLAFTGVCTEEMCSVSQGLDAYKALGADVIAVSVDNPFAQEAWAKANKITVTIASDFNKEASKAFGVLNANFVPGALGFAGVSDRSAFVIGKDGVVKFAWTSADPKVLPPFDLIKAAL